MARKVTLQQIAETLNLSPSTVSQALANKGRVSPKTVELVKKTSEQLGYTKSSDTTLENVGILFSTEKNWGYLWVFIRVFIESLKKNLRNYGIQPVILPIDDNTTSQELLLQSSAVSAKALIILHLEDEQLIDAVADCGIPILAVMNNKYLDKYMSVCNDDFQGAYDAVSYLYDCGHRKIAYLGTEHPATELMGKDRLLGVKKAVDDHGMLLPDENIILFNGQENIEKIELGLKRLFEEGEPPTALYCLHDQLAERVYVVLNKNHISVPDDVSIITAGDSFDYSQFEIPKLTTMRSQTDQMGVVAADMLNRVVNLEDTSQLMMGVKIRQKLVDRGSCKRL